MIKEQLREIFAKMQPWEVGIVVSGFTGHRTTLLEELTPEEAERLLNIYRPQPKSVDEEYQALKEQAVLKEWRSNILAAAEKAGIKKPNSFTEFNGWMQTYSKFKKQLTAHNLEELKAVHRQLRALMENDERSAKKPMTKAWMEKGIRLKNWN